MVFRIRTQSGGYLAPVLEMDKNGYRFLVPDEQGGDLVILPMIDKNELGHSLIRAMVVEPCPERTSYCSIRRSEYCRRTFLRRKPPLWKPFSQ